MKAPLTGNSITERVHFTGLYVAEPTWYADADDAVASSEARESAGQPQAEERLET
ncbi:MAG TPA: hypothetical protein VKB51_05815 [bacterium]|nr:hypothetical protein [bacterium]